MATNYFEIIVIELLKDLRYDIVTEVVDYENARRIHLSFRACS